MKNLIIFLSALFLMITPVVIEAQVAISNDDSSPHSSAMLEVKSTDKGILIPRMTTAQRTAIAGPAEGIMVYDTDLHSVFIYYEQWRMCLTGSTGWQVNGNSATSPAVDFLGTTDNVALKFRVNNIRAGFIDPELDNVGFGKQALGNNPTGMYNTALGTATLATNTDGYWNVAVGYGSAFGNLNGSENVAIGTHTMLANLSGNDNLAAGFQALYSNTTGSSNVALGKMALYTSTTQSNNVAIGDSALFLNGTGATGSEAKFNTAVGSKSLAMAKKGSSNTAIGYKSMYSNMFGGANTATGCSALYSTWGGLGNTATGYLALYANTNGSYNTASGNWALYSNIDGSSNTAVGDWALFGHEHGNSNTAVGEYANAQNLTGHSNVAIGSYTLANSHSLNNLVAVGDSALLNNGSYINNSTDGICNTALGSKALMLNLSGYYNTATGYQAAHDNYSGHHNTASGYQALYSNTDGYSNTAIGSSALYFNQTGNENAVLGDQAGYGVTGNSFSNCTLLGFKAGKALTTGSNNILIGHNAGDNMTTGSNNVIIGFNVDATTATKSNEMILGDANLLYGDIANKRIGIGTTSPVCQLQIQNNGDAMMLIKADADNVNEDDNPRLELRQDGAAVVGALGYCGSDNIPYTGIIGNGLYLVNEYNSSLHFGTDSVITMTIMPNGRVGILNSAPEQALHVTGSVKISSLTINGPVYSNNGVLTNTNPSDLRLKDNILGIENSLDKMMLLRPVTFNWKSDGKQGIGFIAQELEEVIPELVATGDDGNKGIYTVEMIPFLVKALQEQQAMIDELQKKVAELEEK